MRFSVYLLGPSAKSLWAETIDRKLNINQLINHIMQDYKPRLDYLAKRKARLQQIKSILCELSQLIVSLGILRMIPIK